MKKFFSTVLILFILTSSLAAHAYTPDKNIRTTSMLETIRILSSKPRGFKNKEISDARQYITDVFNYYKLNVSTQSFTSSLTDGDGNPYTAVNIIGSILPNTKQKTDDILIIGAHYDGANNYPAANDNGSGMAVMFEMIRLLQDVPTDTEIRFIAFDAEEPGLIGSEYYAKKLGADRDRVIGMLNFDMLAGKRDGEVRIDTMDGNSNYLLDLLKQSDNYSHLQPHKQEIGISDHQSFYARGIPILYFEHPAIADEIHKATDTIDTISPSMLVYAADAGLTLAKTIMSEDTPSYQKLAHPDTENKIYTITKKMRLPFYTSAAEFENQTGIHLSQIPSADSNTVYKANVKLLNMQEAFILNVSDKGSNNSITEMYITIPDNASFEKLKNVMTTAWGGPEIKNGSYIWHNIYGNTYTLNQSRLQFYPYSLFEDENYYVVGGNLKHVGNADVTDLAGRAWERLKPLLGEEEKEHVSSVRITTDGIGGDLSVNMSIENGSDLHIDADYADILNFDGSCYSDEDLKKAINIAGAICENKADAPHTWAKNDVVSAMKSDILPSNMAHGFLDNITRLEFCQIAYNLLKDKIDGTNTVSAFTDVDSPEVSALASINVISGRDDEHFAPNDELTREEAAVILSNIAEYLKFKTISDKIFIYTDDKNISEWACECVYKMRNLSVMSGMDFNCFQPQSKYTKQHAIATIMRLYYIMDK